MKKLAPPTAYDYATWTLALFSVLFLLQFRLLGALIAGLLVYELVHALFPFFTRRLSTRLAKVLVISLVTLLVIGAVTATGFGIVAFMRSEGGSLHALFAKMADILEESRAMLPCGSPITCRAILMELA